MVSDSSQTAFVSMVEAASTPSVWATANHFQARLPKRNSPHRAPYSPHPRMVAKAKQHRNAANAALAQSP